MNFNKEGKFVILQVADPQDTQHTRHAMIEMLEAAYDKIKPDLIVFTGDNCLGRLAEGKNKKIALDRLTKVLDTLLQPNIDKNIPFAVVFGNHDDQCGITKKEQIELYREYKGCVGLHNEYATIDYGTYNIPLMSFDGTRIAYNLWMISSAGRNRDGDYYDWVDEDTINWYIKKSEGLKYMNGGKSVNSLMFQHVPVPEIYDLLSKVSAGTKGAYPKNGAYYKLNPDRAEGLFYEAPCECAKNFGQLDAIAKQGDVSAIVFGHDHINSFIGKVKGIDLIQSPAVSFRSYNRKDTRAVRVFELDENKPEAYKTYTVGYGELMGKGISAEMKLIMQADEYIPARIAMTVCASLLTVSAVSAAAYKIYKKYKRADKT